MKMLDYLRKPDFLNQCFCDRGPAKLRDMLKQVPIRLINFDLGALYGAANLREQALMAKWTSIEGCPDAAGRDMD